MRRRNIFAEQRQGDAEIARDRAAAEKMRREMEESKKRATLKLPGKKPSQYRIDS